MRRFVLLFILLPLAVVIVVLSVANRGEVTLSLDPFGSAAPLLSMTAPLFVFLFAMLALGIFVGGVATWVRQGRWRRIARHERARADKLAGEVDRLSRRPAGAAALPPANRDAA
jgi:uncharacterized protein HemY